MTVSSGTGMDSRRKHVPALESGVQNRRMLKKKTNPYRIHLTTARAGQKYVPPPTAFSFQACYGRAIPCRTA